MRLKNKSFLIIVTAVVVLVIGILCIIKMMSIHYRQIWNEPVTQVLTDSDYANAGKLEEILALNLVYVLDVRWNQRNSDAFYWSMPKERWELTDQQLDEIEMSYESFVNWEQGDLYIVYSKDDKVENGIRPLSHMCYTIASAWKFNLIEDEVAVEKCCKLISALAKQHCSNTSQGWGNHWQSALWAKNVGFAAWIMSDYLSSVDIRNVRNMIQYEADRLLSIDVPYYRDSKGNIVSEGDTKAEDNAWNATILALAVCMYPQSINANKWEDKMLEYLLAATATPEDIYSDELIDGKRVGDILKGSNINSDGTLINHNLVHIDYICCTMEGMLDVFIIYRMAGRDVPQAATRNHSVMYSALVNNDLGLYEESMSSHHFFERTIDNTCSEAVAMPGVNDWGGNWYPLYFLIDTEAEVLNLDSDCSEGLKGEQWGNVHLSRIEAMVKRNTDGEITGQFFQEGENMFISGETYMIQNLMKAYMLRRLMTK